MWISSNRSLQYLPLFLHGLQTKLFCLKPLQRSVAIPPMVSSFPVISRRDLSRASNTNLLLIGASSTMLSHASLINLASDVPFLIEQRGTSHYVRLRGTLEVLWMVRPPGISVSVRPLLEAAIAIFDCDRIVANIV